MATQNCTINISIACTPMEEQVNLQLDFHQMLYNYLRLLRFDTKTMSAKHHITFDKDLFRVPNQKAFHHVVHFLFTKLDGPRSAEVFRDVWPIVDRKQEAEFRKKVKLWFVEIQESNKDAFLFSHINPSIFLSPGGDKFAQLLCALACHILNRMPKKGPTLTPPNITNKTSLATQFKLQMLKGSLASDFEDWIKITNDFQSCYNQYKQLSRKLLAIYRDLCQQKQRAKIQLHSVVDQSSLSDSQKQSLFDVNNNGTCIELAAEIDKKQSYLNSLMDQMLIYEKPFQDSWCVINSVLEMKKGRPSINGGKLINQFSREFIERYQNVHSGTSLELQKKNGRYDFLPLLNLVLFAIPMASELSNTLNFPALDDEIAKLTELTESASSRAAVTDQLYERWSKIFNNQTETIGRLLQAKFQSDVPMTLQPVTPFRNALLPTKDCDENGTPAALRAALGMTPAIEMGLKSRMRPIQKNSNRNSLDLLGRRPVRDEPRRVSGQFTSNRPSATDKLRSQENGHMKLELCRRKSSTPDSAKNSSIYKTPILHLPAHSRLSRPSSLAASPILERVMQSENPLRQRRSLPQIVQQLETASSTPTMNRTTAVLERAAEAIVYDLVSLDSPLAPQTGLIDPNSSFEKGAFTSRNMILRSPQPHDDDKLCSLDLLKVLESKFISPRRSSLNSRSGSPLPNDWLDSQFDCEKGLLDASSASLIDDILDFSLGF